MIGALTEWFNFWLHRNDARRAADRARAEFDAIRSFTNPGRK